MRPCKAPKNHGREEAVAREVPAVPLTGNADSRATCCKEIADRLTIAPHHTGLIVDPQSSLCVVIRF